MGKQYMWWSVKDVAAFLGTNVNNVRQITWRMQRAHEKHCKIYRGYRTDCGHMIPDHFGLGQVWYDADVVKNYALNRRGPYKKGGSQRVKERRRNRQFDGK